MIDIEKLSADINIPTEKLKQFAERYASELKADNENLVRINNSQAQEIVELKESLMTAFNDGHEQAKIDFQDEIQELQSHINDLREAFKEICNIIVQSDDGYLAQDIAEQALSKTPAQSLQEHDNEVKS